MKLIAALVLLLALSACSLPVFYRVPIVQGNIVTADQVAKLKLGMTKKQVAYVLGTPLIKSPFESNRWDYVFYYRNPNAHVRQSKLNLYFDNGKLSNIQGNQEYIQKLLKSGQQSESDNGVILPGQTNNLGAPPGSGGNGHKPANASGTIPHSNSSRPTPGIAPTHTPAARPTPGPTGPGIGPSM